MSTIPAEGGDLAIGGFMSRDHCHIWKTWINNLSYCSHYKNTLCENVKDCPAHYDDKVDNIGRVYHDAGDNEDEVISLVKYKGIIVELKNATEVTKDGRTKKVILLTLDNGINLKSEYETEFFNELQEAKQTKAIVKFLVDIDDNSINSIYYPKS